MTAFAWIIAFIVVQRLGELALAARNTRRLLAAGGQEWGRRHYPLLVALHVVWLAALVFAVPADTRLDWWLVAVFAGLQAARVWVVATLGRYWTTRVITVADAPLVRRGPYRFIRHPNYLVVAAEIAVVPLIAGAWQIAIAFSLANAALLWHRIRVEQAALAPRQR